MKTKLAIVLAWLGPWAAPVAAQAPVDTTQEDSESASDAASTLEAPTETEVPTEMEVAPLDDVSPEPFEGPEPPTESPVAPPAEALPPTVPQARFDLNDDGSAYVRVLTWHQIWARAIELNPGTTVDGSERDWTWDVGLRRSRLLVLAQLPRVQLLVHVGINNQGFAGARKPQLFVHDAWGSVDVVAGENGAPSALTIGAGLHYWNGISRLANASTISMMALDAPIVNWPTIEKTDQFGRQLGLFAKGQLGRFDYRVALNRPFSPGGELQTGITDFRPSSAAPALASYLQVFALDRESNALPYATGTYLGQKRVLTIGAGFHWQNDAMGRLHEDGTVARHDLTLFGADVFVDHPIASTGAAFTGYAGYYHYDFGPDYVRNVGILNVGTGGTSYAGAGNAYPVLSTGHHLYTQAGVLLPRLSSFLQIQPYATFHLARAEAIDDTLSVFELGVNWLFLGHHAKLTTHWRSRPVLVMEGQSPRIDRRASELMMQLQVFL